MNPRTGCTAISHLLEREFEGRYAPEKDIRDEAGSIIVQKKHTSIPELLQHEVVSHEFVSKAFKFVTVRNPFDSLYSLWAKKRVDYAPLFDDPDSWVNRLPGYADDMEVVKSGTFADWVDFKFGTGKQQSLSFRYLPHTNFVMRFESLQQDFERVCLALGRPIAEIPVKNKTAGRDKGYRDHYVGRSREQVQRSFGREINLLGYSF